MLMSLTITCFFLSSLHIFSPATEFLPPVQGPVIKTGRMNRGTSNLLEPPTLGAHNCSCPGAALGDFSPCAETWHGGSTSYLSSRAETAGFTASELTATGWLLTAQQQSPAFLIAWVLEISRKEHKDARISPFIPEGITTGHRSFGLVSWHKGSWQQRGCPSFGVQRNTAARGVEAACPPLPRTGQRGSITQGCRFCHEKEQNRQQPPAATVASAMQSSLWMWAINCWVIVLEWVEA